MWIIDSHLITKYAEENVIYPNRGQWDYSKIQESNKQTSTLQGIASDNHFHEIIFHFIYLFVYLFIFLQVI
jgi:hypothetical protein